MATGLKNAKWWDSGEFRPKYTAITYEEQPPGTTSSQIRTNLVLTTYPTPVTAINLGESITFRATLTLTGVALVGQTVLLQESVNGVWTTRGTGVTNVLGQVSYTLTPTATTVYRAYFAGT